MSENPVYKIFEDEDWFVVAKKEEGKKIEVIYEGHHLEEAYRSILEDLGIEISIEERNMEDGNSYKPSEEDFQ